MKEIKFFDLMERSFTALKKSSKKMWIIGVVIAIFSGGLIVDDGLGSEIYTDDMSIGEILLDENGDEVIEYSEDLTLEENIFLQNISIFISTIVIVIIIFIIVVTIMSLFIYIANYYLYHSSLEALFDNNYQRASLGLVVKVNAIVTLKIILGLILFVIPGIVIGVKYLPVNYILCKYPQLSSKEILSKTREFSKGFKWKIFIYQLLLTIISSIILFICVPSSSINNSSLMYILCMIISLLLTTFISVYTGIFNINLFKDIEYLKEQVDFE